MTRIVLATDFSDASRPALRRAARLAAGGGDVVLLHVLEVSEDLANGDARTREIAAEERNATALLVAAWREELERADVRVLELILQGLVAETIIETAHAENADLLVLGTHGRTGVRRLLLGSVAEKVARGAVRPLLVARGPAEEDFERVLVATALDEHGERAAEAACRLAAPGATVDIVHYLSVASLVSAPGRQYISAELPRVQAQAARQGAALVERLRRPGLEPRFFVELTDPRGGTLARLQERGYDLVALGSHGRGGLARVMLGSVSEAILRHAPCSVLIVR